MMVNRKKSHKKGYYRALQVAFWAAFVFLIALGIFGVVYEDDMPFIGFFWAGVLVVVYLVVKIIIKRKV